MSERYEITNLRDLARVPPERLGRLVEDLLQVMPEIRQTVAQEKPTERRMPITFNWIDDGGDTSIRLPVVPDEIGVTPAPPRLRVTRLPIEGLLVIDPVVHRDPRGFFLERFHPEKWRAADLPAEFAQENHSRSVAGVIRGLHYQYEPPQGKLVSCIRGRIWDVAVDIRPGRSFGMHYAVELSGDNLRSFWIPAGFAHGFVALEESDVVYKTDAPYNAPGEGVIRFDDPQLGIPWPVRDDEVRASPRDANGDYFYEYAREPRF